MTNANAPSTTLPEAARLDAQAHRWSEVSGEETESYFTQEFDYPRSITRQQYLQLTPDQRTLPGFEHRVPADIPEMYVVSEGLSDLGPIEGPHKVHRFD